MTSYPTTKSFSEHWLVDSGCTNHITHDPKLFRKLDKTINSKVRIGNGAHLEVKSKGTVAIKGLTSLKLISNVLYVPEINKNILSVGQLLENGYKVLFEDKFCLIIDAKGTEVFKVQMQGKIFTLNMLEENITSKSTTRKVEKEKNTIQKPMMTYGHLRDVAANTARAEEQENVLSVV